MEFVVDKDLLELAKSKRCVIFIGAGMTEVISGAVHKFEPGVRQWQNDLVNLEEAGLLKNSDLIELSDNGDRYRKSIDMAISTDIASTNKVLMLNYSTVSSMTDRAFSSIMSMQPMRIVTTNFDRNTLDGFKINSDSLNVYQYPNLPILEINPGDKNKYFFIHGILNDNIDKIVYGQRSFDNAYGKWNESKTELVCPESILPSFLMNLFTYEQVVFMGINLTDLYLSYYLKKSQRVRSLFTGDINMTPHFFLDQTPSSKLTRKEVLENDERISDLAKEMGIKTIYYPNEGRVDRSELRDYLDLINTTISKSKEPGYNQVEPSGSSKGELKEEVSI